jgi:hypothetical protein
VSYLFVFRAPPDIDHMTPLAWRLLEEGERVHAVVQSSYDPNGDHRLALLQGYEGFRLHRLGPLRGTLPFALALLKRERVRLLALDWGSGLPPAFERLRSPAGALAVLRSLVRSVVKRKDPVHVRSNFAAAARVLGIPTVCLPHGLSVKLDGVSNTTVEKLLEDGPLPWSDRNRFSAFVFNTEHHRQWYLDNAMGDPEVMQTWGSLRWSPTWFEKNRELAPPFEWPERTDKLKVVYMVPKWRNRVHADEAVELLRRLQELDFVSIGVMGHPRPAWGSADPLRSNPDIEWSRIHDVTGVSSVSLIAAADVVIDVGSSIGLEVVMQGKVLVNPTYVHELETLFDSVEGAAVVAQSADEVVEYLRAHAGGAPHVVDQRARDELMRETVYGSREAPFDVLEEYASRVKALAARNGNQRRSTADV